ncbi:hypothetical protein [Streptomyces sp. FH025]|uniref:hypothetical protein n=1 Tax=Streptomyces sp. FH025 TaxID=2815937 RepID=UPI001A9CEACE|nr:hypothetical protein [Streptomyces sp. FH025]MBO1419774.1 hypothetical protein [Streptomyces sp. FH025]
MSPTIPFQGVLYLAGNSRAFPGRELNLCESCAKAFNWAVALIVVDDEATTKGPEHRPVLQAALQRLRDSRAGAILVPNRSTISPIDGEFHEFAERVEKACAVIQVAAPR